MPTKITPIPKTGGGGGGEGGATDGGASAKSGSKPKAPTTTGKKIRFFTKSRFRSARAGLSTVTGAGEKGYLQPIIFTGCVGLGFLIFGSVLVAIGRDMYIVDVMVLGSLCIVMGVGSLVLGSLSVLLPVIKERNLVRAQRRREIMAAHAFSPSAQASRVNPTFIMEEFPISRSNLGTTAAPPRGNDLYDLLSLGATQAATGKLIPPSPPSLSQPLTDRVGTTCTVLTGLDSDSAESISEYTEVVTADS